MKQANVIREERRIFFGDDELKQRLLAAGFDVPTIVIASWGKSRAPGRSRRQAVEGYIRRLEGLRGMRTSTWGFPLFLVNFDVSNKVFNHVQGKQVESYDKSFGDISPSEAVSNA